jgi:membrane associated rhomboid family serine protease
MGSGAAGGGFLGGMPPAVRQILLVNVIVFLVTLLLRGEGRALFFDLFSLTPDRLVQGMVWQLGTYMFLHSTAFLGHIFFNMFGLVVFGSDLERWWGSRDFIKYYLITGIGGGLFQVVAAFSMGGSNVHIVGASASILGLLIAFAMAFPNRQMIIFPLFIPISARTLAIFYMILFVVFPILSNPMGGNTAHFAHLGGAVVGYLYLRHQALIRKWRHFLARQRGGRPHRHPGSGDGAEDEAVDRILAKISREGMGSLTAEERRILHESAERARKRQHRS